LGGISYANAQYIVEFNHQDSTSGTMSTGVVQTFQLDRNLLETTVGPVTRLDIAIHSNYNINTMTWTCVPTSVQTTVNVVKTDFGYYNQSPANEYNYWSIPLTDIPTCAGAIRSSTLSGLGGRSVAGGGYAYPYSVIFANIEGGGYPAIAYSGDETVYNSTTTTGVDNRPELQGLLFGLGLLILLGSICT